MGIHPEVMDPEVTVDGQSLGQLFGVTTQALSAQMNNQMLLRAAEAKGNQLAKWVAGAQGGGHLCEQVAEHVCTSLTQNLGDVFAGAWSKYSELKQCARETRKDPKSTTDVALADHDFTWTMDTGVDVQLNGKKVASIPFTFAATCTVSGLELTLKQGSVVQVRSGKLNCEAQIRCANNVVWTRALGGVNLPGELRLSKPIALDS